MREAIPFCSFGGYRWFSVYWWKDLYRYITYGWCKDIQWYWQRARYGCADRDTWNFDGYMASVMSFGLRRLAEHSSGTPSSYPYRVAHVMGLDMVPRPYDKDVDDYEDIICDHDQWHTDLLRWSQAFEEMNESVFDLYREFEYTPEWSRLLVAEEKRRMNNLQQAFTELAPWFDSLWD